MIDVTFYYYDYDGRFTSSNCSLPVVPRVGEHVSLFKMKCARVKKIEWDIDALMQQTTINVFLENLGAKE